MSIETIEMASEEKESLRLIVRLRTSYMYDHRRHRISMRKDIEMRRKLSNAPDFMFEDASNVGADGVFGRIVNLNDCEDGLYEVGTCNVTKDWETGYVDDYDYKLIPYKEES